MREHEQTQVGAFAVPRRSLADQPLLSGVRHRVLSFRHSFFRHFLQPFYHSVVFTRSWFAARFHTLSLVCFLFRR